MFYSEVHKDSHNNSRPHRATLSLHHWESFRLQHPLYNSLRYACCFSGMLTHAEVGHSEQHGRATGNRSKVIIVGMGQESPSLERSGLGESKSLRIRRSRGNERKEWNVGSTRKRKEPPKDNQEVFLERCAKDCNQPLKAGFPVK